MASTVNVVVSFPAVFDISHTRSGEAHVLNAGTTVGDLLSAWGISSAHQRLVTPIVAQEQRSLSYVLQEGDELFLFLPVGGG